MIRITKHKLNLLNKPNLKECLAKFYKLVNTQQRSCESYYTGWPPKNRIEIDANFKPLNRKLFIFNRQLKDGITVEPTLVFCCDDKPMLMLNKTEFQSLVNKLPWIKEQFIDEKVDDKCPLATDINYTCRKIRYPIESGCNKSKVTELAGKYKTMIEKAAELNKLQDQNNVKSAESCGNTNTACTTTTECSTTETCQGKPCNCPDQTCACGNTSATTDSVFKKLCEMMCCNQESGSNGCKCGGGNCNSISTFCKEVDKFMTLVNSVIKQNGAPAQESTPTPCNCTKGNCESCKTRRFIRLIEEYTRQLNGNKKCECKDMFDNIFGSMSFWVKMPLVLFGWDLACKCCKYNYEDCLKDGYKCGISHVMRYIFCCKECNCVGVPEVKPKKKRSAETNSENADEKDHTADITDNDKLCKCLVKVFKEVASKLKICEGQNQKCPCSCASDSDSDSCSCLKECCNSTNCKCPCRNEGSSTSITLPLHTSHTTHHHSRITVIHFNISHSHSVK